MSCAAAASIRCRVSAADAPAVVTSAVAETVQTGRKTCTDVIKIVKCSSFRKVWYNFARYYTPAGRACSRTVAAAQREYHCRIKKHIKVDI